MGAWGISNLEREMASMPRPAADTGHGSWGSQPAAINRWVSVGRCSVSAPTTDHREVAKSSSGVADRFGQGTGVAHLLQGRIQEALEPC